MYQGRQNIQESLLSYTGHVRFTGVIDSGATTTSIPIKGESFKTSLFNGCMIRILDGSAKGEWREVSTTSGNTITLANALSTAPSENDKIVIFNFNNTALQDIKIAYRENVLVSIASNQNISGGVTAISNNFSRWTLYLKVAGAINITVELSPDGGTTYYEIPESPIVFGSAGDKVFEMGYDATNIRLTGSNTVLVTAQSRGLY